MSSRREQGSMARRTRDGMQSGRRVAAADDVGEPDHLHARIARRSVYEAHDPTGEPGAVNRHAGFGEQGLETRRWEPD